MTPYPWSKAELVGQGGQDTMAMAARSPAPVASDSSLLCLDTTASQVLFSPRPLSGKVETCECPTQHKLLVSLTSPLHSAHSQFKS